MLLTSFVSCVKDPNSGSETSNSITFGNYEGMKVMTYDSIDWEYYEDSSITSYDYSWSIEGESCGFGLISFAMHVLHEVDKDPIVNRISSTTLEFQYETVLQDIYEHIDTTTIQTDSIPLIIIDGLLTCNKVDESDQLIQSNYFDVIVFHSNNEVLSLENSFAISSTASYEIFNSNFEFPQKIIETPEATIHEKWVDASYDCLNAPLEKEFYIGFKYSNGDRDRLGWIKLIIEPNENCMYLAKPIEAAIQE